MDIITIANHKGGTGKTATTHALGAVLASGGRQVLLVDVDPQASLTAACGVNAAGASLAEVLGISAPGNMPLARAIRDLGGGLHLAPADIALAATELGLVTRMGRESVLKKAVATVTADFDVALIDTPPSLGLLTLNALTAAEAVLIPTQPQVVDLRGLRLFLDTLKNIQAELNPELEILGILVTFYDRRLTHHQAAMEAMRDAGLPLLPVMIGRSIRVAEAAAHSETVVTYEPRNPQAEAYRELGEVVQRWLDARPT